MKHLCLLPLVFLVALAGCATSPEGGGGRRLLLSGNDSKQPMVDGGYRVVGSPGPDTLTVLDASVFPPKKIAEIEVQHSVAGPPMTVAITADEKLALVSAPNRVNPKDRTKLIPDHVMQIVDLEASPPRVIDRVELGHHPLGVSVNRAGTLALAAHMDGNVSVMTIRGKSVKLAATIRIGEPKTSLRQVAITPDGKWALVGKRGEDAIGVLAIDGDKVAYTGRDIAVGNNPYGFEISNDGSFAVVGNMGRADGSNSSMTLIDLTRQPFAVSDQIPVANSPEGVAISPDSRMIAVSSQNGTNRPKSSPLRNENGRLALFSVKGGKASKLGEAASGQNPQGVSFTPDGKYVAVQNYVEKEIAFYRIGSSGPEDTGLRISVPGNPAGFRIAPR